MHLKFFFLSRKVVLATFKTVKTPILMAMLALNMQAQQI
jgi:hypothetical protein